MSAKREFDEIIRCVKTKFRTLLTCKEYNISSLPANAPLAGIYLFSDKKKYVYVGRTNTIRKRLLGHTHNSHNTATFAFLIARRKTGNIKASYKTKGSRKDLLTKPDFRRQFDLARGKIRQMNVQFVEEEDPIRQAILEIYTAIQLKTPYNDFRNH